jgi:hypothetical protein
MDKTHIVQFLKEKKRGIYAVIVEEYINQIGNSAVNLALEIIRQDLESQTGQKVLLNYFSLNQALSKYRKANKPTKISKGDKKKYQFKDAHEEDDKIQDVPGSFKID